MKAFICFLKGHIPHTHLDYIYGSLPREHTECLRCEKTLEFVRPNEAREQELQELGDVRDGDTRGCKAI